MKNITKIMINRYSISKIDWMGYKVSKDNPYTYHHLLKKENGGKETIENGAILTKIGHEYLNIIESRDIELYNYINNILKQINEQGFMPLERQLLAIDAMLKMFEKDHRYDRISKNKRLIKENYLKR
ncbi:MAG: hypothetical protein IJ501_06700 [Bacilli bacterium]|nr:hypothetical protein [Bacilli bacterium]